MGSGSDEGFWSLGVQACSFHERQMIDLLGHHLRRFYDELSAMEVPEPLQALAEELDRRAAPDTDR